MSFIPGEIYKTLKTYDLVKGYLSIRDRETIERVDVSNCYLICIDSYQYQSLKKVNKTIATFLCRNRLIEIDVETEIIYVYWEKII